MLLSLPNTLDASLNSCVMRPADTMSTSGPSKVCKGLAPILEANPCHVHHEGAATYQLGMQVVQKCALRFP